MFQKTEYLPSTEHNPDCNIAVGWISKDAYLTYGRYIKPSVSVNGVTYHLEFVEYYSGKNYCPESTQRSYSRIWHVPGQVPPTKWRDEVTALRRFLYSQEAKR